MKLQALTLAALCSVSSLFAQHATMSYSPRTECSDKMTHWMLPLGDGSAKFLCFDADKLDEIQVTSYDKNQKKTEKTIKTGPWSEGRMFVNQVLTTKHHKYLLASNMDRKKECTLSYLPIDASFGSADIAPHKVITIPSIMPPGEYLSRADQSARWDFSISPDSTKVLGKCELLNTDRNPDAGVSIYVWNEDMQLLWKQDYVLPRKRVKIEDAQYCLSNNGTDAYMLYKYWDDYNHPDSKPGFHYDIARFSKGSSTPVVGDLEFKDLYLSDLTATTDPDGKLVVAAIVQQSYTDNFAPGFALLQMSASGKIEGYRKGVYTLSENEIKSLMQIKADRKASKLDNHSKYEARSPSMHLMSLRFNADGGLNVFTAPEYYSVSSVTNYDGSLRGQRFADNIYAFRISASGNLDRVDRIPRLSTAWDAKTATGPDGSDYFYVFENTKNATMDLTKESPVYIDEKTDENNVYNLIRLKPDGSYKRMKLLPHDIIPADKSKYIFYLDSFIMISENECVGVLREMPKKANGFYHDSSIYFRAKLEW